jgi:hypothetical protein
MNTPPSRWWRFCYLFRPLHEVLAYITRSFPLAHPMSEAFSGVPIDEHAPGRFVIQLGGVLTERYSDPHITIYATYAAPENIEIYRLSVEVPGIGIVARWERGGGIVGMPTVMRPGRWERYVRALCWLADERWRLLHAEGNRVAAAQRRETSAVPADATVDVGVGYANDAALFPSDPWQTGYTPPRGERPC